MKLTCAIGMLVANLVLLLPIVSVKGHMQLNYPPTFNASNNPFRTTAPDPYLQYPYNCCGRKIPFPCRGYLSLVGTPQGASVVSWPTGSVQNFSLTGIGNHYGGSCQIGFSVDNGTTWRVATSFEGNCPLRNGGESPEGQTFRFNIPVDIPYGRALFAWVWYNREREMNMNCAAVTLTPGAYGENASGTSIQPVAMSVPIALSSASSNLTFVSGGDSSSTSTRVPSATTSSASSYIDSRGCSCTCPAGLGKDVELNPRTPETKTHRQNPHHKHDDQFMPRQALPLPSASSTPPAPSASPVAWDDRPQMLFADMDNGCITPHTTAEVKFPDPGPDVVPGDGAYPLELPGPADKC